LQRERAHDPFRDGVLHRENIREFFIERARPERFSVGHFQEPDVGPQVSATFLDASFEDGFHSQLSSGDQWLLLEIRVAPDRPERPYDDLPDVAQSRDERVRHSHLQRRIAVFRDQRFEWKHRDARMRRGRHQRAPSPR
jgi:hypothetical protein